METHANDRARNAHGTTHTATTEANGRDILFTDLLAHAALVC